MEKETFYTEKQISRKTFMAFTAFTLFNGAATAAWLYIKNLPPDNGLLGGVQPPIRKVLTWDEQLFSKSLSPTHLAKTYPVSAAVKTPRVNGDIGMSNDFDAAAWQLSVTKAGGSTLTLTLDDIKKLPKTEIVFDFKCIEGWSQVTHWGGVAFKDFVDAYHLTSETAMQYVGLSTPDYDYYVGIDMPSALHPQTMICYEMNGRPLPINQGYPLRMIIPVKYGIKSIKRIGTMYFDNERPADYWFERGYDYYSGL